MTLHFKPKRVFFFLLSVIGLLTIFHLAGVYITLYTDLPKVEEHLVRLVDLDKERNIPAYYSALSLLFAGLVLGYISGVKRRGQEEYKLWLALAVIFVFLSVDEAVSFHELLSGPVRSLLNLDGVFYLAWVVPYGLFAVVLFVFYIRFLLQLPRQTMFAFILSGFIYISGAVGFELLGSSYYEMSNVHDTSYFLISTVEELLEMIGVAIFIYALLSYIQRELSQWELSVKVR